VAFFSLKIGKIQVAEAIKKPTAENFRRQVRKRKTVKKKA